MNEDIGHSARATGPAAREAPSRRVLLLELAVFLFLIVPSMSLSYFTQPEKLSFTFIAASSIVNDLALLFLVLFFVWRNGESFAALGLRVADPGREIALGAVWFIPFIIGVGLFEALLHKLGFSTPSAPAQFLSVKGSNTVALGLLLVSVVAVAEETIFRGYLILRFGQLTGSTTAAVALSTVIFAFGHGYEGSAGAVTVAAIGLTFAVVYLRRGNLVAAMTMHFLQDFTSIVLVPLFGR